MTRYNKRKLIVFVTLQLAGLRVIYGSAIGRGGQGGYYTIGDLTFRFTRLECEILSMIGMPIWKIGN